MGLLSMAANAVKGMAGGGGSSIVKDLADAADKFITTDKDRAAFAMKMADIAANDRASARQNAGKMSFPQAVLAFVVCGGFLGLVFWLASHALPDGASEPVMILFGALSAGFGQVLNYLFGTSAGSQMKTHLLGGKK